MLKQLDTFQALSEQDYGPWLDRVTLHEDQETGKLYLEEQFGYSKPYDRNWYEVGGKPTQTLAELFGGLEGFCGHGVKEELEANLGQSLTKTSQVRAGQVS